MRHGNFGSLIALFIIGLMIATRPVSATPPYSFQVGVKADIGSVNVTGASVQIMTHGPQSNPQGDTSFWVGLYLSNKAFIQVGYLMWASAGDYPQRFWEYFPSNTTSQGGGTFHGDFEGDEVGPNGTWYTYSLQSSGNVWSAYINGVLDGSVYLGTSNSGGKTPYAVAEAPGTLTTHVILGPAEFRNLAYRDTNNVWHNVTAATGYVGYAVGSGRLPADQKFPYGLRVLGVNDWLAGSGLPQIANGQLLWEDGKLMSSVGSYSEVSLGLQLPWLSRLRSLPCKSPKLFTLRLAQPPCFLSLVGRRFTKSGLCTLSFLLAQVRSFCSLSP